MKGYSRIYQLAAEDMNMWALSLTHSDHHDREDRDQIERRFLGFYKLPGGLLGENLGRGVFITWLGSETQFVDSSHRGFVPVYLRVSTRVSDC